MNQMRLRDEKIHIIAAGQGSGRVASPSGSPGAQIIRIGSLWK